MGEKEKEILLKINELQNNKISIDESLQLKRDKDDGDKKIQELKAINEELKKEKGNLVAKNAELKKEKGNLVAKNAEYSTTLSKWNEKLSNVSDLSKANEEFNKLTK